MTTPQKIFDNLSKRTLDDLERLYGVVNGKMQNFPTSGVVSDDVYWTWRDIRQTMTRLFVEGI